jgi:ABC-type transport system involved in multi-copper enzyme maturation permease subunit
LFAGPIFKREFLTSPRQLRHYLIRAGYVAALLVLMGTVRQVTIGFQDVTGIGATARFGNLVFQITSLVQMSLVLFFALLFSAAGIAQEKDRQTLILLLMTDLKDRELVLGKLGASLLMVFVLIVASVPAFFLIHQLGGVTVGQIAWSLALCAATALAAGSWGALVAFWREKTFQTLAAGVLGVVLFIGVVEGVVGVAGPDSLVGRGVGLFDPYRALWAILAPLSLPGVVRADDVSPLPSLAAMLGLAVVFNVVATWRLRAWNPTRSVFRAPKLDARTRSSHRAIWRNPVLWREIRTSAYGRKVIVIKLAYVALAVFAVMRLLGGDPFGEPVFGMISPLGMSFVGLALLSLMLVNAQAVTSLTSERDGRTLELLLMTDVTAKEFIFGKLGGVLYNWKEAVLIPPAIVAYFLIAGGERLENLVYVVMGFLTLVLFAAALGLHAGLSYQQSRTAIANSLGTMFFLFIGIFIFMLLLVEARSSFVLQFTSFLVLIGVGSIALSASLSHKNPSMALAISAAVLPFLTFYSITEFLLRGTLGVCLAICAAYGFTTLAMLVPAVSEFDVALGRTTHDKG